MGNILQRIAERSKLAIPVVEGDYQKDGLWYCGKCDTPKQTRIHLEDGTIIEPMCLCSCMIQKDEEEKERLKKEEFQRKIRDLRKAGFPDADMQNWTFDKDDFANEKISGIARKYVENFDELRKQGKGLLLFGSVGTGKTFAAACIANALIEKGIPCMVTNFARLVNTISGMFEGKQEYIDSLNNFELLVIDDLASERDTEYMGEIIQNIVDSRYRSGKPLIITTNLTAEELKHPQEMRKQRIYSRLFEMCVPIEVKGKDRRKEKLKDQYNDLEKLLGL